ncbi:hypothetical protein QJS04_geneDACA010023 [Acorus gramineus]|uniref:MULE transposase domain-containing protein n=1 Tax=Acorus gramineus TaxID=55184 RepID=A0AAV9BET1_ACOGR|nr:hypothetical protein QJS04_geneDACA010023 [Acorus gramineus]
MGFTEGCKPFIGLDECHLKGVYKGIMLSATLVDVDSFLFLLAFVVVESEAGDSWRWFLEMLYDAIGDVDGLALMSDKDKGLESAVPVDFLGVEHRTCVRHLYSHFKKKYPGGVVRKTGVELY